MLQPAGPTLGAPLGTGAPPIGIRGMDGAVVTPHYLATAVGLDTLRRGGSAVDAAIAASAALAVVAGNACGLGGDAFWLVWDQFSGREMALNGSGRASHVADRTTVARLCSGSMPERGPLTITVPGAVQSWHEAHRRFGRLPVGELIQPAVGIASRGFAASERWIRAVEKAAPAIAAANGPEAPWFAVYRPAGRPWRPGEIVRLPVLGKTLTRLADDGLESFYDGELASRQASFLAEAGSPIDELDLRAHQADWAPPIETTYRGVRVTSHPPNSSGVSALELLNVWERFDPPAADRFGAGTAPDSRWVHLGVEAAKLVMRDRETHVTDPGFHNVPVSMLLDVEHATQLAGLIRTSQASTLPATTQPTGGGTAYLAVVDRDRNVVSLIQSNYLGFGSGVLDPMTGILYQNRGSYFSLDSDHVNVLQPGKRTLHTLLPTLLFRGDRPWIVTGSMGGDAQPQVVAQVVSDLTDGSLDIAAAIARPRWFVSPARQHAQVDEVKIEGHFGETICHELAAMGHPVRSMPAYSSELGECHAIEIMAPDPRERSGSLVATADPRSDGLPGVY